MTILKTVLLSVYVQELDKHIELLVR